MKAMELAEQMKGFFDGIGYPFPGEAELRPSPPELYPLIVVWDGTAEIIRVIACCDEAAKLKEALGYAETMAAVMEVTGQAATGTGCHAAWSGGFINSEE